MTHPNAALIDGFYRAFQARDGEAMARVYAKNARFSDPVFQNLRGDEPGAMWRMLCKRATDLVVTYSDVDANDTEGRAHWEARYTFSGGGKVLNVIDARFRFEGGLVVDHEDTFDLTRWCGMALGMKGKLLGWTPFMQGAIRKQARTGLVKFMASEAQRG